MDTLAGTAMPTPSDPTERSFVLLDQAERDRLRPLLRPLPWIDGLLTALVLPPNAGGAWVVVECLSYVWNEGYEDEIGKLTEAQTGKILTLVMDHYNHVVASLLDETYRPYLGDFSDPLEAAAQWASGFCGGLGLQDDEWATLFADEEARLLLVAISCLVRDEDLPGDMSADSPFRELPPEQIERMRRETVEMLPRIVLDLHDRALSNLDEDLDDQDEDDALDVDDPVIQGPQEPYVRAGPKVGRNDSCPCGSGRKYKKCCLTREDLED